MPDDEDKHIKTTPPISKTNNVQLEDIRLMLLDQFADNYAIKTGDLYFSDEELMDAMRRAVEAYNALPPTTLRQGLYGIPDQYLFKVGTAWQACLAKALYFQRKRTTYNAGNTTVDMYGSASQAMLDAAQEYKQEFKEIALSLKRQINAVRFYGRIG